MKTLLVKLFVVVFAIFGAFRSELSFLEEIRVFEKAEKTIVLQVQKVSAFNDENTKIELKKIAFFRIVPPLYETIWDTLITFDETKYHEDMAILYKIAEEQILVASGGYKWVEDKAVLNICTENSTYEWTDDQQIILKYVKEPDEYGKIKKVVVGPARYNSNGDWEQIQKQLKRAREVVDAGSIQQVIKRTRLIKNGYLEEISEADILKNYCSEDKIIKLEKGFWQISEKEKPVINCEATLQNIQIVLKSMGYETNTDGKETNVYRAAKSLFMTNTGLNKSNKRSEKDFLIALGFEAK